MTSDEELRMLEAFMRWLRNKWIRLADEEDLLSEEESFQLIHEFIQQWYDEK